MRRTPAGERRCLALRRSARGRRRGWRGGSCVRNRWGEGTALRGTGVAATDVTARRCCFRPTRLERPAYGSPIASGNGEDRLDVACMSETLPRLALRILSAFLLLAVLIQFFIAGMAAMTKPEWWTYHNAWIEIVQWLVMPLSSCGLLDRRHASW